MATRRAQSSGSTQVRDEQLSKVRVLSLEQIFAVPIWVQDLEGEDLDRVTEQIDRVLDRIEISDRPWDDLVKTTFSFQGTNDLRRYRLARLESWIWTAVDQYCQSMNYDPKGMEIQESWINRFDQGDFMYDHTHPGARISGTYYHRATEDQGAIRFKDPNPLMQNRFFPSDQQPFRQGWRVEPKHGRLIMFPSWLVHRVEPNTTDRPRTSIPFNIY